MSISVTPLLNDLSQMSEALRLEQNTLKKLKQDASDYAFLKGTLYDKISKGEKIDASSGELKEQFDKLYATEEFQFHPKIYVLDSSKESLNFVQEIAQFSRQVSENFERKRHIVAQKQSHIEQYQQEILRIINQISQCASILNR